MTSVKDYQIYDDIEHVRARSDMYIGSIKGVKEERWIIEVSDDPKIFPTAEKSEVQYNPGLEQCILELITNATDHAARCESMKLYPVTKIQIQMDKEAVCVRNDGSGIPIEIHPDTITEDFDGLYVPEMIFGNMRTSSNYDDDQKKTWGGKNGIGAKAANIFSIKLEIP
jgi:DNA topoisomerase-2